MHFKDISINFESNWLDHFSDFWALLWRTAESRIAVAVHVFYLTLPLLQERGIFLRWHSNKGTTSIDDGWILLCLLFVLERFSVVVEVLCVQSPWSDAWLVVTWGVLEGLETLLALNDLGRVVSSEKSIWLVLLFTRWDTHGEDWLCNNTIIEKWPNEIFFSINNTVLWCQSKDAVCFLPDSMTLVQCQELEECTFVLLLEFISLL